MQILFLPNDEQMHIIFNYRLTQKIIPPGRKTTRRISRETDPKTKPKYVENILQAIKLNKLPNQL